MDPVVPIPPAVPAPADSTPETPKPPVAEAPPPADSPKPESGQPPLSPEEKRLRDTQRMAHEKAQEAADAKRANAELTVEVTGLREKLAGVLADRRFAPVAEPEPISFGDDVMGKLYEEYTGVGEDKAAFGLLVGKTLDLAEQRVENKRAREEAKRTNEAKLQGLVQRVREQITTTVKEQAPDVADMEVFWRFCAPLAEERTPHTLTSPVDRWEWQMKESVKIYRERFGGPAAPAADADNLESIRRPATAVVSGGSLQPRGGQPSSGPRRFVDQLGAMQERILPGARRPA